MGVPTQSVILCGGLGTRLGALTADVPKPLLPVGGRPFLEILIQEVARSGVRDFLLLAGHHATQVEAFAAQVSERLGSRLSVQVSVEQGRAGTGGALKQAYSLLADEFFLLNGDSFMDCPLHLLTAQLSRGPLLQGVVALREVEDVQRFGSVTLDKDGKITSFMEKRGGDGRGLINAGVYLFRKAVVDSLSSTSSLEQDLLPLLAKQGVVGGVVCEGHFVDIGLPETYEQSQLQLTEARTRKAIFLDRDGVINVDLGHVGEIDRFKFTDGAVEAIRAINRAGYYAFVVTNQAGIAKGKYTIDQYWLLRDQIRQLLHESGAQIDDERFCPFHPEASEGVWRENGDWRKPGDGMLRDLAKAWPISLEGSFLIGDQLTDLAAATAFGIRGFQFHGGRLDHFVERCIAEVSGSGS